MASAAYGPSLNSAPSPQRRTPAARRAPMSHQTDMIPNAARKNRPDHFVPVHSPSDRPATQRHGRPPSHGPIPSGHVPRGRAPTFSASSSRLRSRSTRSAANPQSAKNMTMMSRIAVRDMTKCDPSNARRNAATHPSAVEPNRRRPTRPTMRIDSVPSRATENRHPHPESAPNINCPNAMTHLPTGGCTTKSPSTVENTSGLPPTKASSGFFNESRTRISTPKRRSE